MSQSWCMTTHHQGGCGNYAHGGESGETMHISERRCSFLASELMTPCWGSGSGISLKHGLQKFGSGDGTALHVSGSLPAVVSALEGVWHTPSAI